MKFVPETNVMKLADSLKLERTSRRVVAHHSLVGELLGLAV